MTGNTQSKPTKIGICSFIILSGKYKTWYQSILFIFVVRENVGIETRFKHLHKGECYFTVILSTHGVPQGSLLEPHHSSFMPYPFSTIMVFISTILCWRHSSTHSVRPSLCRHLVLAFSRLHLSPRLSTLCARAFSCNALLWESLQSHMYQLDTTRLINLSTQITFSTTAH